MPRNFPRIVFGKLPDREKKYGPIIVEAMRGEGVPSSWGLAFARVESSLRPNAVNNTGGDATRGGAWGLFQMTLKTAQECGFKGEGEDLLDAEVNAEIAARFLARLMIPYRTLRDVASAYNSGHPYASAPESTRDRYVPLILKYVDEYAARSDLLTMRV